jgi:hypothetical protein
MADRLTKGGLPYIDKCVFCNSASEDGQLLFIGSEVIIIIWSTMLCWAGLAQVVPLLHARFALGGLRRITGFRVTTGRD